MKYFPLILTLTGMLLSLWALPSIAVEVNPSAEMIDGAIKDGDTNRESQGIEGTTNRFGKYDSICGGWGFLQTKLWNVRETSKGNARKMKATQAIDIEQYLSAKTMLVTYAFCSISFKPTDHHVVLKQGNRVVQPVKVSVSRPEYVSSNTYMHTVQAHFSYDSFDPIAETILIVIPSVEEKREYGLNLAEYR